MSDFSDSLFWNDVSGEYDHQQRQAALVHAKVAVAPYWAFLSAAASERDFDNRLSLSLSRISSLVAPETLDDVLSSLRDDYRAVTAGAKSSQDDKDVKKNSDDAKDQAEDETGTDSEQDKNNNQDPDNDDTDNLGKTGPAADSTDKDNDKKNTKGTPKNLDKDKANDDSDTTGKGKWDDKNKTWTRKTTSTFVPDPSDKDRYYAPYADLESLPLNNGDLQGPDGFVADLAEGEQRTPEAYARQTTPGTWTQGPGMPERPMPQGIARGYQPVAAQRPQSEHSVGTREVAPNLYNVACRGCNYGELTHGRENADFLADTHERDPGQYLNRNRTASFDKEGFLIESVVDPVPGAPLAVNPFYFDQGRMGLTGEGFPEDPGPEPLADRANDYGVVGPVSTGSEEGQVDGKGYSRSQPGRQASVEPRNFNLKGSKYEPTDPDELRRYDQFNLKQDGHPGPRPAYRNLDELINNHIVNDHGNLDDTGNREYSQHRKFYDSNDKTGRLLTAADHYNRGFYDAKLSRQYAGEEHQDTEEARTYREGWDDWHNNYGGHAAADRQTQQDLFGHVGSIVEAGEHAPYRLKEEGGKWYVVNEDGTKKDQGYSSREEARDHQKALYANVPGAAESAKQDEEKKGKTASTTDGRIVDHCPGCDKPRRVHSTAHGDEIRHLHNNHVRCFGPKTSAQMGGEPTFKPGDRVISFRGEGATIHRVYPSNHPGKSNRVQVRWDDPNKNLTWDGKVHPEGAGDQQAYYENVFSHHPDTLNHIGDIVDSAVPHSDQISRAYASIGWGHDTANHGTSWSFQDALKFNGENYTTHFDKEGFVTEAADYLGRPDANNPTGRGADEYKARTWDAYTNTRPMQSADDRNVNTPVLPAKKIRTRDISPGNPQFGNTDRLEQSGEEDED